MAGIPFDIGIFESVEPMLNLILSPPKAKLAVAAFELETQINLFYQMVGFLSF